MTFEREMAMAVALAVKSATAPLLAQQAVLAERIAQLEVANRSLAERAAIPGPPGEPGPPGRDGADGKDGSNGKDGRDGIDGKDGSPGLNGKDGRDGLDGKDGAPGLNGKDGQDGAHGKDGSPGLNGKDGAGIADLLFDDVGHLVATFSDGRTKVVGLAKGKDGAPGVNGKDGADGLHGKDGTPGLNGKDGRDGIDGKDGAPGLNGKDGSPGLNGKDGADGLGFEDVTFTFDPVKGYAAVFSRGELVKEQRIHLPYDARVWQAGVEYPRGAGVTVKGSWWIAQEDNRNVRPGDGTSESARCWRLAVKAGQNGKDGKDLRSADEQ